MPSCKLTRLLQVSWPNHLLWMPSLSVEASMRAAIRHRSRWPCDRRVDRNRSHATVFGRQCMVSGYPTLPGPVLCHTQPQAAFNKNTLQHGCNHESTYVPQHQTVTQTTAISRCRPWYMPWVDRQRIYSNNLDLNPVNSHHASYICCIGRTAHLNVETVKAKFERFWVFGRKTNQIFPRHAWMADARWQTIDIADVEWITCCSSTHSIQLWVH